MAGSCLVELCHQGSPQEEQVLDPQAPGTEETWGRQGDFSLPPVPSCGFYSGVLDSSPLTLTQSPPTAVSPHALLDLACPQEW